MRKLILGAIAGLAAILLVALLLVTQLGGHSSAATRDCQAQRAWVISQGHPDAATAGAYNYCLHDPHRMPASFWQAK